MKSNPCYICSEINPDLSNRENARRIGVGESTVRRHLQANHRKATEGTPVKGSIDVTPDGAQVNNVVVEGDLNGDWSKIFDLFNLDASKFEVVDDTVKMNTWQQSKALDNGQRDIIQLYSYSARFKRVSENHIRPEVVDSWRKDLQGFEAPEIRPALDESDGTYVILVADPQLGKKGTDEAVANWKNGILGHFNEIMRLEDSGTIVERIHLAFMGDEHEGVVNNYPNQPHTVELNFTRQIELDFDLRVWSIKQLIQLGLPLSVSSVISNHGEWTRNGSKDPTTTRGDNSSTFVARLVKRLFDESGIDIEWHIAEEEPGIYLTLSDVPVYFTHGYIEKGRGATVEARVKNAMDEQILADPVTRGTVRVWFSAHYHHFYSLEDRGRTVFGCPALEAERSSEYMLDQFGVWSKPGMLGMVLTNSDPRGWSHLTIQ